MEEILSEVKKIHLVGVGGIGMSGLALLLKAQGFTVSGSDIKNNYILKKCRDEGIKVTIGHRAENINSADLVCFSSAVREDNIEMQEAKRKNIPLLRRAEVLALISADKKTVAVSGSHGKTTTASLLGFSLSCRGYNPAVFVGGVPINFGRHAWWGDEYFVIEADESDESFLFYNPQVSIITNIDCEHLDYYGNIERLQDSFLKFACRTKNIVIGWGDDQRISDILKKVPSISFGLSCGNRVRAENIFFDGKFTVFDLAAERRIKVTLPLLGEHNILNALAVFAFFIYLGEDLEKVSQCLREFKGTRRRWEIKAEIEGVTFIDDYAHHPAEIKAVLKAGRSLKPQRLIVIFQPHRFSRINFLYNEFSRCFSLADEVIMTDIYSAGEEKIAGVDEEFLLSQLSKRFNGPLRYVPKTKLPEAVPLYLKEGDTVLALGAGDINILMEEIISEFKKSRAKTRS